VGFLKRVFGGRGGEEGRDGSNTKATEPAEPAEPADAPVDAATADDEERARELELARFDQDRLDDLVRRQQRYADRSWTPPAQGGDRRADDEDANKA
jgi:hypothetical protein